MHRFKYTKDSGEVSERIVVPIGVVDFGTDRVKLHAIDLSDLSAEEREEHELVLKAIHRQYLDAIKNAGLASHYRYFFLRGISAE
jgi:hypothetical protein